MTRRLTVATLALLALALQPAASSAASPDDGTSTALRHNPFRRPVAAGAADESRPASVTAPEWRPTLRGVLLAGGKSLANVEGQMVAIGETLDGHRLLSVSEYQAVFEMNGRRTTLDMRRPRSPDLDP